MKLPCLPKAAEEDKCGPGLMSTDGVRGRTQRQEVHPLGWVGGLTRPEGGREGVVGYGNCARFLSVSLDIHTSIDGHCAGDQSRYDGAVTTGDRAGRRVGGNLVR